MPKTPEDYFYEIIHDLALCYLTDHIGTEILDLPDPENAHKKHKASQMRTALSMIEGGDCPENREKLKNVIYDYSASLIDGLPSFLNQKGESNHD